MKNPARRGLRVVGNLLVRLSGQTLGLQACQMLRVNRKNILRPVPTATVAASVCFASRGVVGNVACGGRGGNVNVYTPNYSIPYLLKYKYLYPYVFYSNICN